MSTPLPPHTQPPADHIIQRLQALASTPTFQANLLRVLASQRAWYEQLQRQARQPARVLRLSTAVTPYDDDLAAELDEFVLVVRYAVRILGRLVGFVGMVLLSFLAIMAFT
jgi:hypothetical protein